MEPSVLEQLVRQVSSAGIGLSELLSGAEAAQIAYLRMHVFHLLAKGRLSFEPYKRPLDDQTLIFPGGHTSWDLFDSLWAPSGSSMGEPGGSSAS